MWAGTNDVAVPVREAVGSAWGRLAFLNRSCSSQIKQWRRRENRLTEQIAKKERCILDSQKRIEIISLKTHRHNVYTMNQDYFSGSYSLQHHLQGQLMQTEVPLDDEAEPVPSIYMVSLSEHAGNSSPKTLTEREER
jgi:hypothetical protein